MPTWLAAIAWVAYASLVIELALLHVPSVASSLSIWRKPATIVAGYSPAYRNVFELSRGWKLLLFVLPLLAAYATFLYPLLALVGAHDPFGDHAFRTGGVSAGVAGLLIVGGRTLTLSSVLSLRGSAVDAPRPLRTGGLFRSSRNPGLVGMYLFAAGLWVAAPSFTILACMAVYVVYMDFKVRMEEDFLESRFGASYVEYRHRTGRYWP